MFCRQKYLHYICTRIKNMNKISLGLDLYPEFFQTEIIKALYGEKGLKWFEDNKKILIK